MLIPYIATKHFSPAKETLSKPAADLLRWIKSCGYGTIVDADVMMRWTCNRDLLNYCLLELLREGEIEEYEEQNHAEFK